MGRFFISCQLGFEKSLAEEIKNFWFEMIDLDGLPTRTNVPELELEKGGVELETEDYLGYQINFFSKLANRVLLRIDKFEARYFDQFEKNLMKTPFEKYLTVDSICIKSESHKSRLNNEKSIAEACENVFKKKNIKINDKTTDIVYIRINKDRVLISLDTSGDHLHKRGYADHRGEAPLRETLAAYMVVKLRKYTQLNEKLNLLDPFCGSGTLLFESCSQRLPNFHRQYSWLNFKSAPKLFKSPTWKKNYHWAEGVGLPNCYGYDIDKKSEENFKHNLARFAEMYSVANLNLQFHVKDSLQLTADDFISAENLWVIANPPYGMRMKEEKAPQILQQLSEFAKGMVFIHPIDWKLNISALKLVEKEDFNNQGIRLSLSVYR